MKRDGQTEAWRELIKQFIDRKITIMEYLDSALDLELMFPHEYDKEKTRYLYLKCDLNKPIKSSGLLKDGGV